MTKIFKRISAVAMAAAMATTMAVSASARQPNFVDPEVHSGDWNPFTRDRVTAITYMAAMWRVTKQANLMCLIWLCG